MPLSLNYTFLLLAVGALLTPAPARRYSLLGLVPLALGIAAAAVRWGHQFSDLARGATEPGTSLGFLQFNSGLVLLGLGLMTGAAVAALLGDSRAPAGWLAALCLAGGAAPLFAAHRPVLQVTGVWPTVGAAVALGGASVTIFILGRLVRIGALVRRLDVVLLERHPPPFALSANSRFHRTWVLGFLVSAVVMVVSPSLRAFTLAVVVAGATSHGLTRRVRGGSVVPVSPLLSLLLVFVVASVTAIAGDSTVPIGQLGNAPFSTAAEVRLVPWVALAAWGFAGLWPFHGMTLPLAAPLAGVILIRLGADAMPLGMSYWAPVFMPLALLGVGHAASGPSRPSVLPRRLLELLTGLAIIGVFAGGTGVVGAVWLLGSSAVFSGALALGVLPPLGWGLLRLSWLPMVWGAFLVIVGGLASQVTYTVLAAGGIALAVWVYSAHE